MLGDKTVFATIPVVDMNRAKDFYVNKLGLKEVRQSAGGVVLQAGGETHLFLYQRVPSKADHTLANFEVESIEEKVDEMTKGGIKFEQYDIPGFIKTDERGIATLGNEKAAWFKDTEGNILSVSQM